MSAATDGWPDQGTAAGQGSAATPGEPMGAPLRTDTEQDEAGPEASGLADSLTIYLDQIGAVSLLTPSQERMLGQALARGRAVRQRRATPHWILLTSCWAVPARSLVKAAQTLRQHALHLLCSLSAGAALCAAIATVQRCVAPGCRLNRRKKYPSTYQLLLDPSLLALP